MRLARILADSIERIFPDGGLIAFSVGHNYRAGNPNDRGAPATGGGFEADFAEQVLLKAARFLEEAVATTARPIVIQVGNREIFRYEADADALIRWDELRGVLFVDEPGAPSAPLPATASGPATSRAGAGRSRGAAPSAKGVARASGARAAKSGQDAKRGSRPAPRSAAGGAAASRRAAGGAKSAAGPQPKPTKKRGGASGPRGARKRPAKDR